MAFVTALAAGCSTDSAPIQFTSETPVIHAPSERIILRAKFHQTTGPCIDLGNGTLGMPLMDEFLEVEMIEGSPKIKRFVVNPMSSNNDRYPANLIEGRIYKLVLTPGPKTIKQMQDPTHTPPLIIQGTELESADAPATTQK